MRPPHRSRASRIVTLLPARASSRAAIRSAAPAPPITTPLGLRGITEQRRGVTGRRPRCESRSEWFGTLLIDPSISPQSRPPYGSLDHRLPEGDAMIG